MAERAHLGERLAPWRAKRDEVKEKLESLANETGDRWDIVRMGFESAWAELEVAFRSATAKDVNKS